MHRPGCPCEDVNFYEVEWGAISGGEADLLHGGRNRGHVAIFLPCNFFMSHRENLYFKIIMYSHENGNSCILATQHANYWRYSGHVGMN